MKKSTLFLLGICLSLISLAEQNTAISSPNGMITLSFNKNEKGNISYEMFFKNKSVIKPSALGFKLSKPDILLNQFDIIKIDSSSFDESWKPVWGEQAVIRNNYKELAISLKNNASGIIIKIVFRVYNEGMGFRYEFPTQPNLNYFIIQDELTQFTMAGDHKTFWIPGDYDTNEYAYNISTISTIDARVNLNAQEIATRTGFSSDAVQTPLMMKSKDSLYINIHEAALSNYPAMDLIVDKNKLQFHTQLVPDALGNKAYLQAPAHTPWRTINVSDKAANILMSRMILNLNEPCKIENTSWIKPSKFVGVWWEMHVGVSSWDYSGGQVASQEKTKVPHGANTANVKRYIDFAAKNGIQGVLVEGWNTGWEDWFGNWKENVFDFLTPYPDFNLKEVNDYAKLKGIKMIMHSETSGSVANFERHLDRSLNLMKEYGYTAAKTGYVGRIIPRGEFHDGQTMVNHYNFVAQRFADYKMMVNSHESSRPTGYSRTYPNYIAAEATRGTEFNAWSIGNLPSHETVLPFTRSLGGPIDYTPGIFEIKMSYYDASKKEQVHTTLAKQLALYVTLYSPLQMAADLPENYEKYPDAFQFIKDVAADWDDSKYLEAEPGDYLTIARKAKGTEKWFLGAITDENSRKTEIKLDFLTPNKKYKATIYQDGKTADWQKNPINYEIKSLLVTSKTKLKLVLAAGGGTAISFFPIN